MLKLQTEIESNCYMQNCAMINHYLFVPCPCCRYEAAEDISVEEHAGFLIVIRSLHVFIQRHNIA